MAAGKFCLRGIFHGNITVNRTGHNSNDNDKASDNDGGNMVKYVHPGIVGTKLPPQAHDTNGG